MQSLLDVACFSCVAGRGLWLRTAGQCLSCDLVDVQDIVIRDYHMIVKSAGKEICDGDVAPFGDKHPTVNPLRISRIS